MILLAKVLQANDHITKGREVMLLHGGLTKGERDKTVQTIQTGDMFIALMTYDLGSTGHNFQNANQVIFLDRHWNPQVHI